MQLNLHQWKCLKGYNDTQKQRHLLSNITLEGISITGILHFLIAQLLYNKYHHFVELVPYTLKQLGVKYFLSEKICQDPLEKYFDCQRQLAEV